MAGNGSEENAESGSVGNPRDSGGSEIATGGIERDNGGSEKTVNPERAASSLRERVAALRERKQRRAETGSVGNTVTGNAAPNDGGGFGSDPGAPFGRHDDGTPRKRRPYAPRGSRTEAAKDKASLRGLEKLLFSLHEMGAFFLSAPELALDEKEAGDLAAAVRDVQEHYSVSVSPKTEAWINLAIVGMGVYGTRAIAIMARKSGEAKARREKAKRESAADDQPTQPGTPTGAVLNFPGAVSAAPGMPPFKAGI